MAQIISQSIVESSQFDQEKIHLTRDGASFFLNAISGTQGDFFIFTTPSILVSGYGRTKSDARKSFEVNLQAFADDLDRMSTKERRNYLVSLGWKINRYRSKDFSKAFVDKDGILRDLENPTISKLETAY